ncbi:hypothetical protein [Mycobacterium sp. JS623]|uniref:hypothetical protein n=1 Tax=Mycobacterium sp. JS623 TaxID=212767 RepID=UPI0012F95FB3|nr:hypothetical protein [Mycobacterium sp. JS623]
MENPFPPPRGLAGRIMLWTNKHDELQAVLDVQPGNHVLEAGYGPGGLIQLLTERIDAANILGV